MSTWRTKLAGAEFKVMRLQETPPVTDVCSSAEPAVKYLRERLPDSLRYNPDTENFVVLLLNTRRWPIGFEIVSNGTLDALFVHPREVFKPAIVLGAAAIIMAHNHPSGDPTPSEADIKITKELIRCGQLLKIEVLDHLILGRPIPTRSQDYVSLRELGYFF